MKLKGTERKGTRHTGNCVYSIKYVILYLRMEVNKIEIERG